MKNINKMMPVTSPMSSKDLQRLTECVSYIGQGALRRTLPPRRDHITQKVRMGRRTLYVSVHDDQAPAELFLRATGADCTPETIALYDVIARLLSIALQWGASSLEKVGDLLTGAQFGPCGPVSGHDRLKHYSDLRHRIYRQLPHSDLGHVQSIMKEVSL